MLKPVTNWLLASAITTLLALPTVSNANSEVEKLTQDPANWATWGGQLRWHTL